MPPIQRRDFQRQAVAIASGETVSEAITATGFTAFGAQLPAAFTSTALSFEVSADGVTYQALNDDSGAISITVAQGKGYALPAELAAWPLFKLVAGTSEGDDRSVIVVMK